MASVWDLIITASTLPVHPDNSLWDHLNHLHANRTLTHVCLADGFNINLRHNQLSLHVTKTYNLTVNRYSAILLSKQVTNINIEQVKIP